MLLPGQRTERCGGRDTESVLTIKKHYISQIPVSICSQKGREAVVYVKWCITTRIKWMDRDDCVGIVRVKMLHSLSLTERGRRGAVLPVSNTYIWLYGKR